MSRLPDHLQVVWAFDEEEPAASTWGEWKAAHADLPASDLRDAEAALLAGKPWTEPPGTEPRYALSRKEGA